MLADRLDAAAAGFRVGYDSPSQFSREYRRLFGAPPVRDIGRLRATPRMAMAVGGAGVSRSHAVPPLVREFSTGRVCPKLTSTVAGSNDRL